MQLEFVPAGLALENYGSDFSLLGEYINRDATLYGEDWLHLSDDDYTNDAFVYLMPGSTHGYEDCLWISVFEVRSKGQGFGSRVILALTELAKTMGMRGIALHALDGDARMFYHKVGFVDDGENEILLF